MAEVAEVSLRPDREPIRFDPQSIGDIQVSLVARPGKSPIEWLNGQSPRFNEGDVLVIGLGKHYPLAVVTIGSFGEIERPTTFEWVDATRRLFRNPSEDEFLSLKCEVFRTVR